MEIVDVRAVVSRLFEIARGYKGFESPYIAILDAIEAVEDAAIPPCDEPKQESKPQKHKTNRDVLAEMSNEELARVVTDKIICPKCHRFDCPKQLEDRCVKRTAEWLAKEADE